MNGIIKFKISNFRGIAELEARPDGKSLSLRGKNGVGKSSAIDGLWWGLGGALDGEVVRNGAARVEVELQIDEYLVRRRQTKGKHPTLDVRSADGKAKFASPTTLLAGFVGAIERRTFSTRKPTERLALLRQLAPGLDVSDLDAERARVYEERTAINRDAKTLRAQAEGAVIPDAPTEIGEERPIVDAVDVAEIAARKAPMEREIAANQKAREIAGRNRVLSDGANRSAERAKFTMLEAERAAREAAQQYKDRLAEAEREIVTAAAAERDAAALVDPDPSSIDAEIAAARERNADHRRAIEIHNRTVRAAQQAHRERQRAAAERDRLAAAADAKESDAMKHTARLDALDAEKAARTAAAKLPIAGIAISGDAITLDDGERGPVEVDALNTATRIRLDVAIAAALGNRIIAVRDASLLDTDARAALDAFAADHGVQLFCEEVTAGRELSAVIVEASVSDELEL